jgi:hypothetical protein
LAGENWNRSSWAFQTGGKKILIYTGRGLQVSCGGDLSDTF